MGDPLLSPPRTLLIDEAERRTLAESLHAEQDRIREFVVTVPEASIRGKAAAEKLRTLDRLLGKLV